MCREKEIIIFVKAPVPGNVKTRLVPPLGYNQAAELYRAWAREALVNVKRLEDTRVEVAYAAHPEIPSPDWLSDDKNSPDYFMQSGGNLGEKLTHAFVRAFSAGMRRVVIIGSDSPGLPAGYLMNAFGALERADVVIGPSDDGGYYLIGLRNCLQPDLFRDIPWSSPKVLGRTMDAVSRVGLTVELLPEYFDIDTFDDLEKYQAKFGRE